MNKRSTDDSPYKTRPTLLERVKDFRDEQSWQEFNRLYRPLIRCFLYKVGVPREHVPDLTQEVMQIVLNQIPDFQYDPEKGSFRGWLYVVTANRARRFYRQHSRGADGRGGTTHQELLQQLPAEERVSEIWEQEWQKRCLEEAMKKVRERVKESTWESFRLATLEGLPAETVAQKTNLSVGQVYVNKSRVLKWLRETVEALNE